MENNLIKHIIMYIMWVIIGAIIAINIETPSTLYNWSTIVGAISMIILD